MGGDPAGLSQAQDHRSVQSSGCAEVDIFHGRLLAQLGRFETQRQPSAVTCFSFAIDEQPEALVEAQAQVLALLELLAQPERHAEQPQRIEFVEGLVDAAWLRPPAAPAGSRRIRAGWHAGSARPSPMASTTTGTRSRPFFKMACTLLYEMPPVASARWQAAGHALGPVALDQAHQTQARPIAMLRMRTRVQDRFDQLGHRWPDAAAPRHQPRGRPLQVGTVRRRHVLWLGDEPPPTVLHARGWPPVGSDGRSRPHSRWRAPRRLHVPADTAPSRSVCRTRRGNRC